MDATFALALVPALAVLFYVVMPALDRTPARPQKQPNSRPAASARAPYRHSEQSVHV